MKLLVLCLLFGAVLALTTADPLEDKPNNEVVEEPERDDNDTAEPESVDETELTEEPESVDETELSEAEDEDSGERAKRCATCRPHTWCTYRGRHYKYIPYPYHWSQAQKHCLKYGASLASVQNRGVDNFLKSLAKGNPSWIGMFDGANERFWLWVNSRRLTYTNWCPNEPNNVGGKEHCAQINWTGNKCWNDHKCGMRYHFICEKK